MKSWLNKAVAILESPTQLLMVSAQGIVLLSAGRTLTDLLPAGNHGERVVLARVLFSDITAVAFIYALMSAFIAIVYRLRGWPRPSVPENESLKDRLLRVMQDPEASLQFGLYLALVFGLLTAAAAAFEMRDFPSTWLWREYLARMWQHVVGAMVVLIGARAIVRAVPDRAVALSGAADEEEETPATTEGGFMWSLRLPFRPIARDVRMQLKAGGFLLVYLALTMMVLQLWNYRGGPASGIIGTILFWSFMAVAGGLVPMLFIRTLDALEGRSFASDVSGGSNRVSRLVARLRSPNDALRLLTYALAVPGLVWFFVALWSSRNSTAGAFWAFVTANTIILVGVMSIPLLGRSFWSAYGPGATKVSGVLGDPAKLTNWLLLTLLYTGLVMSCLTLWQIQVWGADDAWHIAMQNVTIFGVPVTIMIGLRAVITSINAPVPAREPATASDPAQSEAAS